jgi:antitoxin MazE
MKTVLQKWGNSLALRIPRAFADEIAVDEGHHVDVRVTRGRLVIAPLRKKSYELSELLSGITRKNLHAEVGTGAPRGGEAW